MVFHINQIKKNGEVYFKYKDILSNIRNNYDIRNRKVNHELVDFNIKSLNKSLYFKSNNYYFLSSTAVSILINHLFYNNFISEETKNRLINLFKNYVEQSSFFNFEEKEIKKDEIKIEEKKDIKLLNTAESILIDRLDSLLHGTLHLREFIPEVSVDNVFYKKNLNNCKTRRFDFIQLLPDNSQTNVYEVKMCQINSFIINQLIETKRYLDLSNLHYSNFNKLYLMNFKKVNLTFEAQEIIDKHKDLEYITIEDFCYDNLVKSLKLTRTLTYEKVYNDIKNKYYDLFNMEKIKKLFTNKSGLINA